MEMHGIQQHLQYFVMGTAAWGAALYGYGILRESAVRFSAVVYSMGQGPKETKGQS